MKRKSAKELLAESFRELAAEKNIDKITVRDIGENCGYSTATFYRHFRDKYDLIAWDYSRDVEKLLAQVDGSSGSWGQALKDAAGYYAAHKEYLKNLLLHTTGYDSFFRYMIEINCDRLKKSILLASRGDTPEEKTEMLIRGYCFGTVSLTCEWILGKYAATGAGLAEIYEKLLPDALRQYLY
ncbi:MAG: TetR/AcrR family transcriptional regulator [Clostridia bacterium]|nr:TetR/AcrR family transcriptional regulator [Clostridia bacterium]